MKDEQTTTVDIQDEPYEELYKYCPLKMQECDVRCSWWITDDGKEECAIVKLAKGWCL